MKVFKNNRQRTPPGADNAGKQAEDDFGLIKEYIASHNTLAFSSLVNRHISVLRRLTYTLLNGNREDMEDVEQEILLALSQSLPLFQFKSSFKTYFYRLCRNKAIDFLRKKSKEKKILKALNLQARSLPAALSVQPEDALVEKEQAGELLHWLCRLAEKERILLLLKDVEGLDIKEIKKIVQIPEGTIKSRLHRAREKLLALVKQGREKEAGKDATIMHDFLIHEHEKEKKKEA